MPRTFILAACVVCASAALPGCAVAPTASTAPPVHEISPETWDEIYQAVFAASVASAAEAETYARAAMQEWMDKVRQRTETDFEPWYCGYWAQQWLSLKAAWYQASHAEGGPTSTERLADYLQVQYDARVLRPVKLEIDPDKVVDQATVTYVQALRGEIQRLPERFHVPRDRLYERLDQIPAIILPDNPQARASLAQLAESDDVTRLPAYAALVAPMRGAGGSVSLRALRERLRTIAASIADRSSGKLAGRGAATAASAALGGVGILVGMGITMWGAVEHSRAQPALEAELRQQLRAALDEVWNEVSAALDGTVLGAVRHISSNIDISLLSPPATRNPDAV